MSKAKRYIGVVKIDEQTPVHAHGESPRLAAEGALQSASISYARSHNLIGEVAQVRVFDRGDAGEASFVITPSGVYRAEDGEALRVVDDSVRAFPVGMAIVEMLETEAFAEWYETQFLARSAEERSSQRALLAIEAERMVRGLPLRPRRGQGSAGDGSG
jgi:hypothetical protein